MGNAFSVKSIANYDNVKEVVVKHGLLIHIMDKKQLVLIHGTLSADIEEEAINAAIDKNEYDKHIVVYGKNTQDIEKLVEKRKQLISLGFKNVQIYIGGMFEWALLQDVYGSKEFPISGAKGPVDPMQFYL
jgi:23S rRNA pseudoU1915 N3-methylase RlmH